MRRRGGTVSTLWGRHHSGRDFEYRVFAHFSPGHPGQTYGDPENCYPPEGPEVEYCDVYEVKGMERKRLDLVEFEYSLTKAQDDELRSRLVYEAEEYGTDEEAAAADDAYDRMKEGD